MAVTSPADLLNAAVTEAYASARKDSVYVDTLTISASGISTIRVVRGYAAFTDPATGYAYQPYVFDFKLPEQSPESDPLLEITFSNVSRVIADKLAVAVNLRTPIYAEYRGFTVTGTTVVTAEQMLLPMRANDVVITHGKSGTVVVKCGWDSLQGVPFPRRMINTQNHPGLIV